MPHCYVKLLEEIVPQPFGTCSFDGHIYQPGAVLDLDALPRPAVVLECAGPVGVYRKGRYRDYRYLLWIFETANREWRCLAEAQARDASWTLVLRYAAERALHPQPQQGDVIRGSRDAAEELLTAIDQRLRAEPLEIRFHALHVIHEELTGRIADCAGRLDSELDSVVAMRKPAGRATELPPRGRRKAQD